MKNLKNTVLVLLLAIAAVIASARVAHGQTPINPSALEFSSPDHTSTKVTTYRICVYPSQVATQATRCNEVPKAQAVLQSGTIYRIPRAAWVAQMPLDTNLFPRVIAFGPGGEAPEVGPLVAPFSFRLEAPPAAVTSVSIVP